jgi:hypothetical protein
MWVLPAASAGGFRMNCILILQTVADTAKQVGGGHAWYQIAAGVLAIPATILGIAYSYLLIGKTRLEARKTELEIQEKERQLETTTPEVRAG